MAPKPARDVVIRLSAHEMSSTNLTYPERRVTLTRDHNKLPIGRTSKVEAKGLVARVDNAWFDSPVMSRNHAVIIADMDQKKVQIRDDGSLHGTYLNDDSAKVSENSSKDLKEGDVLRFGVSVMRGTETFPPTALRVGIAFRDELDHHEGTSTFQVPDGSDNSDIEDDYSDDDDDASVKENTLPSLPVASKSQSNTPYRQRHARGESLSGAGLSEQNSIDLTGEAEDSDSDLELGDNQDRPIDLSSPPRQMSPVKSLAASHGPFQSETDTDKTKDLLTSRGSIVDLDVKPETKHAPVEQVTEQAVHICAAPIEPLAVLQTVATLSGRQTDAIIVDEDDEDDDGSIRLSDSEEDDETSDCASSAGGDIYNASEIGGFHDDRQSEDAHSDDSFESDLDEEHECDYSEEEVDMYDEESIVPIWDSSSDSGDSVSSQNAKTAAEAPLPATVQLPSMMHPASLFEEPQPDFTTVKAVNDGPELPPVRSEMDMDSNLLPKFFTYNDPYAFTQPAATSYQMGGPDRRFFAPASLVSSSPVPSIRYPSPSDAAIPVNHARAEGLSIPSWRAAILGEKTGKPEFFAAREENKLLPKLFTAQAPPLPAQTEATPVSRKPVIPMAAPGVPALSSVPSFANGTNDGWQSGTAEESQIDYTPHSPPISHTASRRTYVGISDIVENCQPLSDKSKGKRKAEDISEATQHELLWESNPEAARSPANSRSELSVNTAGTSVITEETSVNDSTKEALPMENTTNAGNIPGALEERTERPIKRVRRSIITNLSYAALGGLTSAAVLFTTLVHTAPAVSIM